MRFPTIVAVVAPLLALPVLLAAHETASTTPAKIEVAAKAKKAVRKSPREAGKASRRARKARKAAKPARELFGAAQTPAPLVARSIGFYAKGCLAGAAALPIDGPAWQAMRLSRKRNWGHPVLVALVERLAVEAKSHDGWPGLLVGDLSQPRGGPMLTGHASHQVGLDADVWFTPMPDRRLSDKERERLSATSMLADDRLSVDPKVWTDAHVRLLKRTASYKEVERVFVHPAIKKAVCEASKADKDRGWLSKIRPWWGHHYHFHIRIGCPKGSANCESQPRVGNDDGCGAELTRWLRRIKHPPRPAKPAPRRRPITLAQLPNECRSVLAAGSAAPDKTARSRSLPARPAAKAAKKATAAR